MSLAELQTMSIMQLHDMRLVERTTKRVHCIFDGMDAPMHAHGRVFWIAALSSFETSWKKRDGNTEKERTMLNSGILPD